MGSACPRQPCGDATGSRRSTYRAALVIALMLAVGCGDSQGAATGAVADVTIDSDALVGSRLGQRWALEVNVRDAGGETIADAVVDWVSSNVDVASVDAEGLVTVLRAGEARITATIDGVSDSVDLTGRSAVPSDVGEMYTTWFARSDEAPVAIIDGMLEVFDIYAGSVEPTTPWPHGAVARFQWEGDRLAILTDVAAGAGTLRVLDRHAEWVLLRVGDVMGFQLEGDRIAELAPGGSLRVRDGIDGPWSTIAESGVTQYQLEGDRIAVLQEDGVLRATDDMGAEWTELGAGVLKFLLHGDRVAAIFEVGDALFVRDGFLGAWTSLEVGVRDVVLDGDRIGFLRKDGVASVQDGIDGESMLLANSYIQELQLVGDRIGMMYDWGDLRVRDGLSGQWTILATRARRFALQEDYIAWFEDTGELGFSVGLEGPSSTVPVDGDVTQLLPVADVPVPPARTAVAAYEGLRAPCAGLDQSIWECPTSYAEAQEDCTADGARCKPVPESSAPTPYYGRFCGADQPTEVDWEWAMGPNGGPMDAFDALCLHRDNAPTWYPDAEAASLEPCIVRYGYAHARLTRDGTIIERGSEDFSATMNKMPNLFDALLNYDPESAGCTSEQLDEFVTATAAKH